MTSNTIEKLDQPFAVKNDHTYSNTKLTFITKFNSDENSVDTPQSIDSMLDTKSCHNFKLKNV